MFVLDATKLRTIGKCNSCVAIHCIYSKKMVGSVGGPTKAELESFEQTIENRDPTEANYYNPNTDSRGRRVIVTENICSICYADDDIVPIDEVRKQYNMGVKMPLPICRLCFDKGVKTPCLGAQ
eukprot:14086419-Ditylum_brightwellii.AAC.2